MTTLDFPLFPLADVDYDEQLSLPERFAAFHDANPHVADAFESLIAEWIAAGNRRVGLKAAAEVLRWRTGLQMPGEAWSINNSYVSFYARLMLERRPEWSEAIELRTQKAA